MSKSTPVIAAEKSQICLYPGIEDTWIVPDTLEVSHLEAGLAGHFTVQTQPEYRALVTYVDTFDWKLYQAGCLLHYHNRHWTFYDNNGAITLLNKGPLCKHSCRAEEFPEGSLRQNLQSLITPRALLPVGQLSLKGKQISLLNEDKKIVLRLVFEEQTVPEKAQRFRLIRVFPLRGYADELFAVQTLFTELGIVQNVSPLLGFAAACQAFGRTPLDYSSKIAIQLDSEQTAAEGMLQVYRSLLETIRCNLPGTIDDLDIEFLHDLRVAVRRTRSAMSLTRDVFPKEKLRPFKEDFARLGQLTGPTRDLDVYLLQKEAFLTRVRPELQSGVLAYFKRLTLRRNKAQRVLASTLKTESFAMQLQRWEEFLKLRKRKKGLAADKPIGRLANRIIRQHFAKVLQDGQNINATTSDAEIHQLRIECKKLRYSLEFFASLYEKEAFFKLLKPLKSMQTILGDFNDLFVQQEMLYKEIQSLRKGTAQNKEEQIVALSALMQSLYEEQQPLRGHFAEHFAALQTEETLQLCAMLFGKKKPDKSP